MEIGPWYNNLLIDWRLHEWMNETDQYPVWMTQKPRKEDFGGLSLFFSCLLKKQHFQILIWSGIWETENQYFMYHWIIILFIYFKTCSVVYIFQEKRMMKNQWIFLHERVHLNVVIFINVTKTIIINDNKLLTGKESFMRDFILGNWK